MTGSIVAQQSAGVSCRAWLAGCLLVLLLSIVVYRPAVTGSGEFEAWDQARVYVPLQVNNARQRTVGEIPLWYRHGFRYGLWISGATLLGLVVGGGITMLRRRR